MLNTVQIIYFQSGLFAALIVNYLTNIPFMNIFRGWQNSFTRRLSVTLDIREDSTKLTIFEHYLISDFRDRYTYKK